MRCSARCSYMSTCLGEHILLPLLCCGHLQDVPLGGLSRHGDAGLVADLGPHDLVDGRIRCQKESTYLVHWPIFELFSHCNWFFWQFENICHIKFRFFYVYDFPPLVVFLAQKHSNCYNIKKTCVTHSLAFQRFQNSNIFNIIFQWYDYTFK